MRGVSAAKSAKLVQVLVFYDEPQLVLLKSDRGSDMLGMGVNSEKFENTFFGCEVREKAFNRYLEGKADLRFAFTQALGGNYYLFHLGEGTPGETVSLHLATPSEKGNEEFWPKVGFFSRSHTFSYKVRKFIKETIREFKIDGNWDASDFSHFHRRISNLYALFSVLNRLEGATAPKERAYIKAAIQERFWQGGGSYVGFYDDMFDHIQAVSPLGVARIQYASPGQIALRGDKNVFSDIARTLEAFDAAGTEIDRVYSRIHEILRRDKLLRASPTARFSDLSLRRTVYSNCLKLGTALGIEKLDEIYEACDKNTLIFAKVILSIYRRANELYTFHAEGRVQTGF